MIIIEMYVFKSSTYPLLFDTLEFSENGTGWISMYSLEFETLSLLAI
jgi:hypothetical protein